MIPLFGRKKTMSCMLNPDEEFISSCIQKAEHFFKVAVLPELIEKFFSRQPITDNKPCPSQATSAAGSERF